MNRKIILVSVAAIMSIILGACRMKSFSYKIINGYGHKWTYQSPDKSLNGYSYFIYRTESKLRINFKKVFKDIDFEIGNEYSMNVTVNYSLDSTSFSKTINYNVKPYETNGSSEWIYNLFPETGI